LWRSLPTGGNFGDRAIELAGIVIDPSFQEKGTGTKLVREFTRQHSANHLTAYTRNPRLLRVLGAVAQTKDVLARQSIALPNTTLHDGIAYHIDRYAPTGLYGMFDPADNEYDGQVLKTRATLLTNPNNALAVAVELAGEIK